jgi:uncharacterized RDD family membrane protein YckC
MLNSHSLLKKRTVAFTIDLALIVGINYFLMASFTNFLKVVFFHFPIKTQLMLIHKFNLINSVSVVSVLFAYFTIFHYVTNGKTMGKMFMEIEVKSPRGELTLLDSIKRTLAYVGCVWFASIPFVLPYLRKDQKSLADLFSNTEVILSEKVTIVPETEFQLTLIHSINEMENEATMTEEEPEYFEQNKAA